MPVRVPGRWPGQSHRRSKGTRRPSRIGAPWTNSMTHQYLEAFAAWLADSGGYSANRTLVPAGNGWEVVAEGAEGSNGLRMTRAKALPACCRQPFRVPGCRHIGRCLRWTPALPAGV
jgi:hypothetical protein